MSMSRFGAVFLGLVIVTAVTAGCGGGGPTLPGISIDNVSVNESNDGETANLVFTVSITREPDVDNDVTVDWTTADGTATTADSDYVGANNMLTFTNGGALTQQVTIVVNGDDTVELNETLYVNLSNAANATISDNQGVGTITNDDNLSLRVDPTGDGSDGLTWATAYNTIQEAVDVAEAAGSDEVWAAAATYDNGGGTDAVLTMKEYVYVYGGFEGYNSGAGAQEALRSQRDFETNVTTLDGQGNAHHVVIGADNAVIDGFTVTGGTAAALLYPDDCGGGMLNFGTSPTVANCAFSGNTSGNSGGGMCNDSASPTVTNCAFSGNSATYDGGGMSNFDSSPTVTNCTFSGNSAGDYGGGMYNTGDLFAPSSPTVTNCTFSGNSASASGGGMCNYESSPTVTNCTFLENSANDSGGGTYNYDSSPTVANCITWDDIAPSGPEIYNEVSSCTVSYSDIEGCGGSGAGWDTGFGTDGGGNIDADPLLDAELKLTAGSPSIDAGDNAAVPADAADLDDDSDTAEPTPLDLDLNDRFIDDPDTDDSGSGSPPVVDMGAYEYQ